MSTGTGAWILVWLLQFWEYPLSRVWISGWASGVPRFLDLDIMTRSAALHRVSFTGPPTAPVDLRVGFPMENPWSCELLLNLFRHWAGL